MPLLIGLRDLEALGRVGLRVDVARHIQARSEGKEWSEVPLIVTDQGGVTPPCGRRDWPLIRVGIEVGPAGREPVTLNAVLDTGSSGL